MPPVVHRSAPLGLVAYRGDAKTLLAWDLAEDHRANLAGFTIAARPPERDAYFLWNRLQLEHPERHAQVAGEPPFSTVNAPLHKFRWLHVPGSVATDREPALGTYTYTVTPRYFDDGRLLALDPALGTSIEVEVDAYRQGSLQVAFTRGYVQSQAYVDHFGPEARIVRRGAPLLADTSDVAGTAPDGTPFTYAQEYAWLGFTARRALFALLDEVREDPRLTLDVLAYDLDEPDVLKALLALAAEGRVRVLVDDARLHHDRQDPQPEDRFAERFAAVATGAAAVKRGHFARYAHDKVMVVSGPDGPRKVLTGSTNFSVSGLYVNSNHVLVFDDAATAGKYAELFEQVWAQDAKPGPFVASPLSTEDFSPPGAAPPRTISFAPHGEDRATALLQAIANRVGAEGGRHADTASVLFAVMALQGSGPVYPALEALHERDDVFSYGISDKPDGIALYAPGHATGVLVTGTPKGPLLPPPFDAVPSISTYHQVHHKFVICAFNGEDPVVWCGSSNLALGGEQENGDNLLELPDADVATVFALEAVALVDHFQFLDRLSTEGGAHAKPPAAKRQAAVAAGWFLGTTDRWARPYFADGDLRAVDRRLFAAPLAPSD